MPALTGKSSIVRPDATSTSAGWSLVGGAATFHGGLDDVVTQPTVPGTDGAANTNVPGVQLIMTLADPPAIPVGEVISRIDVWTYINQIGDRLDVTLDTGSATNDLVADAFGASDLGWQKATSDGFATPANLVAANLNNLRIEYNVSFNAIYVITACYVEIFTAYKNPMRGAA